MTNIGRCSFRKLGIANSKFKRLCLILLWSIALILATDADAQVATGFPPFGTFAGEPDVVNIGNLNVHWSFPVVAKSGRIPFNHAVNYDSSFWIEKNDGMHNYFWDWGDLTYFGWRLYPPASVTGYAIYNGFEVVCPDSTLSWEYADWVYIDRDGTPHPFPFGFEVDGCGTQHLTATGQADDSSGITMKIWIGVTDGYPYATVYPTTGGSINPPLDYPLSGNFEARDSNGNYISVAISGFSGSTTTFTDTTCTDPSCTSGATVLTVAPDDPYTPDSPLRYTYKAPTGNASVTVTYARRNVRTTFCTGYRDFYQANTILPYRITYPDGSYFELTYEATPQPLPGCTSPAPNPGDVTGRIASVSLPTGGSVTYNYHYDKGYNGIWSNGSTAGFDRVVSDGTNSNMWHYDTTDPTASGTHMTTVTDPAGNQTLYTFDPSGSYETKREIYQGSASPTNLLKTFVNCYNGTWPSGPPWDWSPCINAVTGFTPVTSKATYSILPNGTNQFYKWSLVFNAFDTHGQTTETDQYD